MNYLNALPIVYKFSWIPNPDEPEARNLGVLTISVDIDEIFKGFAVCSNKKKS